MTGFCFGIGIESVTNQSVYVVVWILLLALVVGVLSRRQQAPVLILFTVLLLTTALGLLRTQYYEQSFLYALSDELNNEVSIIGEVIKDPDKRSNLQMVSVKYEDTIVLVSTDLNVPVSYGDKVQVSGTLKLPEAFTTDLGRTFDYPGYLKAKGVEYTISFADVVVVEVGAGNYFVGALLSVKHSFMNQLDQVLTEPEGALADGLLLGLNQGLGDQLEEDFRRSGIIHIVVLSGYNIMLVVTFVIFLLSFFMRKKWRLVFGLLAILSFALIVGLSATVARASIMASLLLFAQTFGRTYDVLRALLVAGFVMLIINPYLLFFDIGFQLSFMATIGLIAVLPWLSANEQPEVLTSVRGYVVATVATQIAVMPLLVYHIGEVSVVSVLVNVLVLPAVPFAMLGAFLAGISYAVVPMLGLAIGLLTGYLLTYIIIVAQWFSSLPFATITFTEISFWWIGILYVGIGYGYWWSMLKEKTASSATGSWEIVEEEVIKNDVDTSSTSSKESIPKLFH